MTVKAGDIVKFRRAECGPIFTGEVLKVDGAFFLVRYASLRNPNDSGFYLMRHIVSVNA